MQDCVEQTLFEAGFLALLTTVVLVICLWVRFHRDSVRGVDKEMSGLVVCQCLCADHFVQ